MKTFILFFATIGSSITAFSQSLSGNLNTVSEGEKVVLKYGNVDIYRNDSLIKTIFTDEKGNFKTNLPKGTYKCVTNYAGYPTETRTVVVQSDEKIDLKLEETAKGNLAIKKDKERPKNASKHETEDLDGIYLKGKVEVKRLNPYESISTAPAARESRGEVAGRSSFTGYTSDDKELKKASSQLTAGEINDFAKWMMWPGLQRGVFSNVLKRWNITPSGRYSVQVQTKNGIPIADAVVCLYKKDNLLFQTKTDNTGKAELWYSISYDSLSKNESLRITVSKNGEIETIKKAQSFDQGINHLVLDIDCIQSEIVDIAFVFDATGSMSDELSFLQTEMKRIIFDSKQMSEKLNFRFANVFYKDKGDDYLTKKQDFTRVLTEANAYIDEQSAGGGGDGPEAVEDALDVALNELSWSEDARARIMFLILDAPPHQSPEISAKLEAQIKLAAKKGIRIIPIGASGIDKATEFLLRTIALGTNGTYTFLTNHSGIGNDHIAPSTDSYEVETLHDLMVRVIKSFTYMPDCQSVIPNLALNYPDSTVNYPFLNPPTDSTDTITNPIRFNPSDKSDSLSISWSYYPNPTNGIVTILVNQDVTELYLTDLTGKELQVIKNIEKNRPKQLDLTIYPTGIYLIRYPIGDKWISGKVILNR